MYDFVAYNIGDCVHFPNIIIYYSIKYNNAFKYIIAFIPSSCAKHILTVMRPVPNKGRN